MKFHVEKKARKDIDKLPNTIQKHVQHVLLGIMEANRIEEISNCKKLRGDKFSYMNL